MELQLRDIEPFNVPTVDNDQAALFMRRLSGSERFTFGGRGQPLSMLIHSLKYNYPRHSFASGFLLSITLDELARLAETQPDGDLGDMLRPFILGTIHIEYGGTLVEAVIKAESISWD